MQREQFSDARLRPPRPRPRFVGIDYFMFENLDVVLTKLDRDCDDFAHLIGQIIVLDDVEFKCKSVRGLKPPYKKGDLITLGIKLPLE